MSFPDCKKSILSFRVSSWIMYTCVLVWCSFDRFNEIQKTLNMHHLSLVWWEIMAAMKDSYCWNLSSFAIVVLDQISNCWMWIKAICAGDTCCVWFTLKAAILFWLADKSACPEGDGALSGTRKNEHRLVNVTEIAAFRFHFQISRLWKQSALWYVSSTICVTLDHKTSLKCTFFKIEIYTEWIIFLLMYGLLGQDNIWPRYNYLKIWNLRVQKNLNIEKIAFKVVQMKFLAMHITNKN